MRSSRSSWVLTIVAAIAAIGIAPARAAETAGAALRPPAVPLVAHDPYFSVWSFNDKLSDGWPRHWTGSIQAMCGQLRIDGKPYRFMGQAPQDVPALEQKSVQVLPTRTIYEFQGAGIAMTVTFLTPALVHDLEVLSRPLTYISFAIRSTDGKTHKVDGYFDATGEFAVDKAEQEVTWDRQQADGLTMLRIGSKDQPVLKRTGDNLRIDWGHLYLAFEEAGGVQSVIASDKSAREGFARDGKLPQKDDERQPRKVNDEWPVLAVAADFGDVGEQAITPYIMLAYDDEFSIEHMQKKLRPWWRKGGMDAKQLITTARTEYEALSEKCRGYDEELMADLRRNGGDQFAQLAALSFRQAIAAHKVVVADDGVTPLFF